MATDELVKHLRDLFEDEADADRKLAERRRGMSATAYDENRDRYEGTLRAAREAIGRYIESWVLRYGRHVDRHAGALKKFEEKGKYEESAFVMTKYPVPGEPQAAELQKVIDLVTKSVTLNGFKARIANGAQYHPWLWDNVELHALGCCIGIAIAESKYHPVFNPNVAMEWGWMRGMGRPVIFLVEKDFELRADVEGMLREPFDWDDPDGTIPDAITRGIKNLRQAGLA